MARSSAASAAPRPADVSSAGYRLTGAEDQIGFGVQVDKRFVLGFAFDRGERSFTERDRTMLNLIRPHVIHAYVHLEELAGHQELQRDLNNARLRAAEIVQEVKESYEKPMARMENTMAR